MKKFLFACSCLLCLLLLVVPVVRADACTSLSSNPTQEQIDLCQKVVDSLGLQANTLAGQVTFYDAQIKLVISKITQTEGQIASISGKISSLEDKLQEKSRLLEKQIRLSYKQGQIDPLQVLFSSGDVSQLISRFKYLQIVQSTNRRFLAETQAVQNNYGQQKTLVQDSQKRLLTQKKSLANLRADKENLLNETKKSEAVYQQLLATARAELAASLGQGDEKFMRNVGEGEVIGRIISSASGCSSGQHLHFEIHKDGQVQDPNNYLRNISFSYSYTNISYYGSINPHGSWDWPMNSPVQINQGFGSTGYARNFYAGRVHNGIDIDSLSSTTVKAVKAGKLYSGSIQCGGRYPGSLLYSKVEQSDGITALYLHMVPQ